ncbi:hypothetical protein SASPL_133401 [Salvia splendens]|uniref:Dynamin GTPase n=1 Tax=Salvia splendens TaxID=180675 RepID=A0A8X8ZI25_SALSN|nr:hypothetical protein SASPL_133401 [Salvia splendens]
MSGLQGKSQVVQDELSRLGEKFIHSSEEEDMRFKLYSSRSAQSMERIEELLQEDQNVKRRKDRIQKQSSILSKLTTQLCINDNLAAAASTYSNEECFYTMSFRNLMLPEALTTYMELLDLKPLPVTALANGTYEELYRYVHFNPIQTKDELSRLGEQMVHSSEGKRALARCSKHGKNRRASPGGPECQAEERAYPETKVQPLLAHLPGSSGDATFDTAASGPNLSYGDSRSNCLSRRNSDPFHNECFYTMSFRNLMLPEALTTYMELLDLKPFPVTALANGTYEELYRNIHFNPIQKKTPGQDELSRLGEQMVHSSEGKRALARVLCHELHDKFLQHVLKAWQEWKCFSRRTIMSSGGKSKVHPLLAHLPGRSGDAAFDAAASGPNPSYVDSRSMGPSRWNSDPFQNAAEVLILAMLEERGEDLDRLYEMEDKGIGAIIRYLLALEYSVTSVILFTEVGEQVPGIFRNGSVCCYSESNNKNYSKDKWQVGYASVVLEANERVVFMAHTTHVELLDLKPLPMTALANGTYEELYRFTHFNPIQTEGKSQVVQDELSRLGEQMVHSSEGKRALAQELCYELDDKFLQHDLCILSFYIFDHDVPRLIRNYSAQSMARIGELLQEDQNVKRRKERIQKQSSILSKLATLIWQPLHPPILMKKVQLLLAHLPGMSGDASLDADAAANGPNPSYGDSRSIDPSRRNSDPFQNECFYTMSFRNLMLPEVILRFTDIYVLNTMKGFNLKGSRASSKFQGKSQVVQDELSRLVPPAWSELRDWTNEDMLFKLYSSISAQSMARIGELLQEDQNVKRRKERIQKQSSILSKLATLNLAAPASTYSNEGVLFYDYKFKVQSLLAHLPRRSRAAFDAAASGPNPSYVDSRSNGSSHRNSDPFQHDDINSGCLHPSVCHLPLHNLPLFIHSKNKTIWVDLDRLYEMEDKGIGAIIRCTPGRKSVSILCPSRTSCSLRLILELIDLIPLPVTALANGTYEELYRFIHFNPIQTEGKSHVVQDELSRLGEKMIHISEGTRALARKLCRELEDKFLQHAAASTYSNEESQTTAGPSSVEVWRSAFDAASNGPNPSYGDSRSNGPSRRNRDPSQTSDINPGCRRTPNRLPPMFHRFLELSSLNLLHGLPFQGWTDKDIFVDRCMIYVMLLSVVFAASEVLVYW